IEPGDNALQRRGPTSPGWRIHTVVWYAETAYHTQTERYKKDRVVTYLKTENYITLLLISYSFSLIMFSFFLTPFFDKAASAGIVASFVVSIVSLLYFLQIFLSKSPTFVFWLMSLMSSAGFALAMDKVSDNIK
ncbi:uncharacterized protein LOC113472422, partial [Diaphorina citri]|uniref:Uncharacterized protein LOC113472422 n=1 Tax=Diaphorina citri TaxID=121845 RepID=A0A3Q0JHT9_DIACI